MNYLLKQGEFTMDAGTVKIVLAALAAVAGVTVVVRLVVNIRSNSSKTTQSGNTVGGDQAGRDINK